MAVKEYSIVKKSRLISVLLTLLLVFGAVSVVMLLAEHRKITVGHAIDETRNDMKFISGLLKDAYLNKEFSRIENVLNSWVSRNSLDHMVMLEATNGFVLFEFHRGHSADAPAEVHFPEESHTVVTDIKDGERLLMRFTLVRDLAFILQEYYALRDRVVVISILLVLVLAGLMWRMLRRMVFMPLETEIARRQQAEQKLLESHEILEANVEQRTAELRNSNRELQDVLEKYRLSEAQMEKLSRAIEQTDDIVTITNRSGVIEYVNPSLERVTGYSASEVIGNTPAIFQSGEHDKEFYDRLWKTIRGGESFNDIFINRRKDGSLYYEEKTITPIRDEEGEIIYYVATGKDITDRIKAQERLQFMATHDALTELPNRMLLRDRLSLAVTKAGRSGNKVALLFLDMDKFKHVNDSLGHIVGDQLLRIVAERIGQCVRKEDTIARLGGDEFTIVMEGIEDIDDVNRIAQKVINKLSETIFVDKYQLTPSTSIGITIAPDDATVVDELLKNADIAMYRAKARGGNCYQYFTEDMTLHAVEYLEIQNKVSKALGNDEFELFYQPRIQIDTGRVCGMEALLRWHNDVMGMVMPDKFISVLEESQQIVDVGIWVLQMACEFNQQLISQGYSPITVSVNLSARQFRDQKTLEAIQELQQKYGSLDGFLEVEITETMLVENIEMAAGIMHQLHNMGVSIAVDDFGTGYSSMTYLKRFPIDALKIDRSFVTDTPEDQDDVSIVQAVVALARSLKMRSVAEGVENDAQCQLLKEIGCDEVQGYLISQPVPASEFMQWLTEYRGEQAAQAN